MSTPSTPYKVIHTTEAPGALAPYSQAVVHNGVVYVSGCIPFTTEMKLVEGGIVEQTEQAMTNLFAVVKAAGSDPSVRIVPPSSCWTEDGRASYTNVLGFLWWVLGE